MKITHPILSMPTSPEHAADMAAALIEAKRERFGDTRMEANDEGDDSDGESQEPGDDDATQQQGSSDEHGFPANTPVKDMTAEQQAAYWRHKARKHEQRAEARKDYDAIKAERDHLKQAGMTDAEKAVEAARNEGKAAGLAEAAKSVVTAKIEAALSRRGLSDERVAAITGPLDHTHFLTDSGEVSTDKVTAYADGFGQVGKQWPDMGQGKRGESKPGESGDDLYDRLYGKK